MTSFLFRTFFVVPDFTSWLRLTHPEEVFNWSLPNLVPGTWNIRAGRVGSSGMGGAGVGILDVVCSPPGTKSSPPQLNSGAIRRTCAGTKTRTFSKFPDGLDLKDSKMKHFLLRRIIFDPLKLEI